MALNPSSSAVTHRGALEQVPTIPPKAVEIDEMGDELPTMPEIALPLIKGRAAPHGSAEQRVVGGKKETGKSASPPPGARKRDASSSPQPEDRRSASPVGRQGRSPARSSPAASAGSPPRAPGGVLPFQQMPIADVLRERPFLTLATEPLANEEVTLASLAKKITDVEAMLSTKVFKMNQSVRDLSRNIE